jgi:hypothetical protein
MHLKERMTPLLSGLVHEAEEMNAGHRRIAIRCAMRPTRTTEREDWADHRPGSMNWQGILVSFSEAIKDGAHIDHLETWSLAIPALKTENWGAPGNGMQEAGPSTPLKYAPLRMTELLGCELRTQPASGRPPG